MTLTLSCAGLVSPLWLKRWLWGERLLTGCQATSPTPSGSSLRRYMPPPSCAPSGQVWVLLVLGSLCFSGCLQSLQMPPCGVPLACQHLGNPDVLRISILRVL